MATHADWLALVSLDGLVVSEPVLEERFPEGPPPVPAGQHHWFRRQAERYRVSRGHPDPARRADGARQWVDYLLAEILDLPAGSAVPGSPGASAWKKAAEVPAELRVFLDELEQELRPDRVLMGPKGAALVVNLVPPDQELDRKDRREGRWKASPVTKLDRLLRETRQPLGLVTNGEDFRLLYAPAGLTGGQIGWSTRLLTEEKATLDAFAALLGRESLLPESEEALSLADLCRLSQDRQAEVADQLGAQVRNALERLIWAWDEADRAAGGELLAGMTEAQVYEMGLVVSMRLVFLLYAEERGLLPHGEVLYDQGYGLAFLWHRLLSERREDPVHMAETSDAWARFLAACRLVHRGCGHPDLALIAYGGSLFDPERFPVLEHPACRVSNQVFHEVLHLLLFARQRKGGEPQRVGYWALDVEQIGYVYEGLLDHRCARAGDEPLVKKKGGGEQAWTVSELTAELTGQEIAEPSEADLAALAHFPPAVVEKVRPLAGVIQCDEVVPPGWRYLTTGTSRRASGAHYTPQFLTERIVRATLEPLVYRCQEGKPGLYVEPREGKSPRELLSLRICDLAMGSGAFLVQAVRYLGDRLVEAWDRALARSQGAELCLPFAEPLRDPLTERALDPEKRDELRMWARRYVAERCVFGVDVNPLAVEMAKLSLWLTTLAKDRPFTFVDHALKCGDSLVGVDLEQLRTWSLDRKGQGFPLLEHKVQAALKRARELRQELELISVAEVADAARKQALHEAAEAALGEVRLAGDLILAPIFGEEKKAKRKALGEKLFGRYTARMDEAGWEALKAEVSKILDGQRTFHWPLEFPEVFGQKDAGFDAIVGNPPFVGGRRMRSTFGDKFVESLEEVFPGSSLNADLCAFFYLRAFSLLREGGTQGLLATNTIGQGDSRETGLDRMLAAGGTIFEATSRMPWPGDAAVNVSVVHLVKAAWQGKRRLDGKDVETISSSLDSMALGAKPVRLAANTEKSFIGCDLKGMGFVLSPEEAQALISKDGHNKDVLFPYLNGEDLNTSPDQSPSRWVINFFDWPREKAEEYKDCFRIVEDRVKPERVKFSGKDVQQWPWWRYWRPRSALYLAIDPLKRVLVIARVSRTAAFVFLDKGQVFSEQTVVFAFDSGAHFAIMQSSIHECWARTFSSSLKTDLRYSPSDCFETFPFPKGKLPSSLDEIGEAYHEHRRQVMLAKQEGLTKTYNRFHDPECKDADIQKLRDLHVAMDQAVRDAYGWNDLDLEHGWVETRSAEEKKNKKTGKVRSVERVEHRFANSERARKEVLGRLLSLNTSRQDQLSLPHRPVY